MFVQAFAALAVAAVAANAPAPTVTPVSLAKGATYARLTTPLTRSADPVIDGRIWHCEAQTCRAGATSTARVQSLGRECASAAKSLGAFESYQTGADVVAGDDLGKCNAAARR